MCCVRLPGLQHSPAADLLQPPSCNCTCNRVQMDGCTALICACKRKHLEIVKVLLSQHADMEPKHFKRHRGSSYASSSSEVKHVMHRIDTEAWHDDNIVQSIFECCKGMHTVHSSGVHNKMTMVCSISVSLGCCFICKTILLPDTACHRFKLGRCCRKHLL